MSSKQIYTYGNSESQSGFYPVISRDAYECANSSITRGVTSTPATIEDCLQSFPSVREIAESIGFYKGAVAGTSGSSGSSGGVSLWEGPIGCPPALNRLNSSIPVDIYFDTSNTECDKVNSDLTLGTEWLGCLWGTPSAPYSCVCPDVNPRYEAYIKYRLNVASFWNTPVETPVKRAEFIDALQYGRKVNVTVAGDFNLKVAQVMFVRLNGMSQYPSKEDSILNGLYYVMGIKHVFTSSGTHETALSLSSIAPDYSGSDDGGPYYP